MAKAKKKVAKKKQPKTRMVEGKAPQRGRLSMAKPLPVAVPEEQKSGVCSHPDCETVCTNENYCYGCKSFICEPHSTNLNADGFGHPVAEHWSEEGDGEYDDGD